jgi:hypothetical protein
MTRESVAHIQDQVMRAIRAGDTIDIYALAKALQQHCPDMGAEQIADLIAQSVVDGGGNAVWNKGKA